MRRNLFILLGVVVVGALATVVALKLTGQPQSQIGLLPEQPVSQISILSPAFGDAFDLGSPVVVDAFAFHAQPVTALELWIDGQLMGTQDASGNGLTPFSTSFLWNPQSVGVHTLIARALGANGPLGFSPSVQVVIVEPEPSDQQDEVDGVLNEPDDMTLPAVFPQAEGGGSPVTPPGGSIPPAAPQDSPPEPGGAESPPAAPELAVSVESCTAQLAIHDSSSDELGFYVYRQASNEQTWQQVADLAAANGQGWLAYEDTPGPGGFNYYVAAYNSQGESPSNPVLANFSMQDCLPAGGSGGDHPVLELDLGELLADSGAERAYCYQSLDGMNWSRFPVNGFFMPGADDGNSLISLAGLMEGNTKTLELMLECWGWMGGDLELIGNFQHIFDLPGEVGEGMTFQGSALANVAHLFNMDGPTFFPMGGSIDAEFISGLGGDIFKYLLVHDPAMPTINTYVTYDPDQCQSHLMPDAQNLLGKILFCTPYPGFDSGDEGGNPQPYLVWNYGDDCGAGVGSPPCHSYGYYESLASDVGGNVWVTITDYSSADLNYWTVEAPYLQNFTIPPVACAGVRSFYVTMYFYDGDQMYFSLPSNIVSIDCPNPLPWDIPLDITFETITLSALDDGDSGADDVEVYGYMQALVPGDESVFLNLAEWDEQASECPDESVQWPGSLDSMGTLITNGCTKIFGNGTHNLESVAMCQGTSKTNCSINGWNFNNNTIRVNVTDDQGLMLFLLVYDWDDASGNDLQCFSILEYDARSRFDWALVHDQQFSFPGFDQGNGYCTVSGVINAVVP